MDLKRIEDKIITIQRKQVILDCDVAEIYGVETKRVNEAIRNNPEKSPEGYIIVLTDSEKSEVVENFDHLYTDKEIEKQTVYYNLEVLIFLSYRINTLEAKIFRQFINSSLRERLQKGKIAETKHVWLYHSNQNYWWN